MSVDERVAALAAQRSMPAGTGDERDVLRSFVEFQRATFAQKLVGLTAEQLRQRAVSPSTMSMLGLVRHHAEGERGLMQILLLGEDHPRWWVTDETPELDWSGVDDADARADLTRWLDTIDASRAAEAGIASLDQESRGPNCGRGRGR